MRACLLASLIAAFAGGPPAAALSVADCGAVGDGIADDTAAFAQALSTGSAWVPPGHYVVGELAIPDGARLAGEGPASVLTLRSGAKFVLRPGARCVIEDLSIVGNPDSGAQSGDEGLIHGVRADGWAARDLWVSGAGICGVLLDHCNDVRIQDCQLERLRRAVSIVFSHDVMVEGNVVRDCSEHGLMFWGNWQWERMECRNISFVGNRVVRGGGGAIWGTGGVGVVATGNIVEECTDVGIDLEWCEQGAISGNTVSGAANAGISLFYSCRDVAITGNTVVIPDADTGERIGIWLTGTNTREFPGDHGHRNVAIVGNVIRAEGRAARGIVIPPESREVLAQANVLVGVDAGPGSVS